MKPFRSAPARLPLLAIVVCLVLTSGPVRAAAQRARSEDSAAETVLQKGIALTRSGRFQEAIPLFLSVRGQVSSEYALNFNLALCYVATGQFHAAQKVLNELRSAGHQNAQVDNLLAQSYIGLRQPDEAMAAVQRAARRSPKDEPLYLFVAEACMDSGDYDLGLRVTEMGLKHLPRSARLYFEQAMLLVLLDRLAEAKPQLKKVTELAPGSDVAYIAGAQRSLFDGQVVEAARIARAGIQKGHQHTMLLAIYGEAVIQSGVEPGDVEFAEARTALERAVADRPRYASAQISLGKLYLLEGRLDDAIARLQTARVLDPRNPAVFSNLAAAFRRRGNMKQAEEMLALLAKVNQEQVERIRNAPGDRKAGYASRARPPQ